MSGKSTELKNNADVGAVLVVGGGVGGIQASLDLAESGFKVYLVEEKPVIGGVMAQLDKTFPTNDCSMCILSPKLVDVSRHPNIDLLTYAEVEDIQGKPGNFSVKIKKKSGYVDGEKCTGCGDCANGCPVEMSCEFDENLGTRKAIHIPYPQAVPLQFTIDKKGLQPCKDACPADVGAPGYVALISRGKFYEALKVIKERLPFPSICGRICHRPCEHVCTRKDLDDPVGIAYLKRFVGDLELKIPAYQIPPVQGRKENIAIVGGGPAGLTAAHDLALKGYHVTIFESAPVLGGMMRFGIPTFRLPKEILEREISDILALGVKVRLNVTIGKDISIPDLMNLGYDAVFLAVGAQIGKKMNILGEDLKGVHQAIDFLKEINLGQIITTPIAQMDDHLCVGCGKCGPECMYGAIRMKKDKENPKKRYPEVLKYLCKGCGKCASVCPSKAIKLTGFRDIAPKIGENVVVVGGGNAALDTARSALRLGADNVKILYRRSRDEMPAEPDWEIDETEKEGIEFIYLTAPTKVNGKNGKVSSLECIKMELLDEFDQSGRRKIKPIPKSEFTINADSIILAIGQEVDSGFLTREVDLEYTPFSSIKVDSLSYTPNGKGDLDYTNWHTIKIDHVTLETSLKGVFSAGDAVWGTGTVIEAIAAGKEAAISIDRYINGKDLRKDREEKLSIAEGSLEGVKKKKMVPMRLLPLKDRKHNFNEVELGYSEEEAIEEARRCLNCGGCVECMECVRICEADAVDHSIKDELIDLKVGSIVLAPGYDKFPPEIKSEYGYKRYKNVVTSLEFERLLSASGPFQGDIIRLSDKKHPKRVAWINCVGSRDDACGNNYCSSVCCTYSIKEAIIAKEHLSTIEPTIFYMDMRTFGKGFEQYYNRAEHEQNIRFVRCRVADIQEDPKTKNLIIRYEDEKGKLTDEEFDMVVLSVGFIPTQGTMKLAEKAGITLNEFGFCKSKELVPLETSRPGIFVCGAFSGPKDIPETVIEASGAAIKAGEIIANQRNSLVEKKTYPVERNVSKEKPRIGVFVCHCGINIAGYVNVSKVLEFARTLPHVVYAEENLYTCSQDTQGKITDTIKKHKLNRVIVASCTPRTHEPMFKDTLREAGLNPYLFEMANIRDQCSWVHMNDNKAATDKAKDLVKMIVAKANDLEPLPPIHIDVKKSALIIGGGIAGMTSALSIADQGYDVLIVEKEKELGGNANKIEWTLEEDEKIKDYLKTIIKKVESHNHIKVYKKATITAVEGYVGNFKTTIKNGVGSLEIEHGVVIVATGAEESVPEEYLFGKDKRVLTQLEFEHQIAGGKNFDGKTVVMIQCVGSREDHRPYCSRVCCTDAIKNAIKIKEKYPDSQVFVLYRDMRTYGFKEVYYEKARELGVIFIRFDKDKKPVVKKGSSDVEVSVSDLILNEKLLIHADTLVLSPAIIPNEGNIDLAKLLKVPLNEDGFFLEAHVKLRPVDFATEGVFLAGMAHSPKTIDESIAQAFAASSRACALLSKDTIEVEPIISLIEETKCIGCGLCVSLCPSNAIDLKLKEGGRKAEVIAASCKGCGLCGASCPQKAITMQHFRDKELLAQILAYGGKC